MSNRLDQERQQRLEPIRIEKAVNKIREAGCDIISVDNTTVVFEFKEHNCTLYAYSGWFTGKTVTDGRGLQNLIDQLKIDKK